jgi:glucose 1-dehydrogenase
MELAGRTALVTGSNTGIGKAISLALADAGADVSLDYLGHPEAEHELSARIRDMGRRVVEVRADISLEEQVRDMVGHTVSEFGRIDILVNNAGLQIRKHFPELSSEDWDRMVSVDLRGTFLVTLYAVREMIRAGGGKIINITSVHQTVPKPYYAPYCCAKAGVGMLTETLAAELAQYKITVNAIAPGAVSTDMNQDLLSDPELLRRTLEEIPLARMARPEEVADLAVYLASPRADYITGATFVIDGGLSQLGAKY